MKRSMKLIRMILEYVEREGNCRPLALPDFEDFTRVDVHYHVGLCFQAGFLKGREQRAIGEKEHYVILGLTWEGHEFLDPSCD